MSEEAEWRCHAHAARYIDDMIVSLKAYPTSTRKMGPWMRTITKELGAFGPPNLIPLLKTLFYEMVAGYGDYKRAGLAVDLGRYNRTYCKVLDSRAHSLFGGKHDSAFYQKVFPQGPKGNGETLQMTIQTVLSVLDRRFEKWEAQMLAANVGHPQWSIAAMILGMNCLEQTLLQAMLAAEWHLVPLVNWRAAFGVMFSAIRRCPIVFGSKATPAEVFMTRKMLSCTYRSKEQPDWELEEKNRTMDFPIHMLPKGDSCSRADWVTELKQTCDHLAHLVVAGMAQTPNLDIMPEWWRSRWGWAPQGSTSLRHKLKEYDVEDDRLPLNARPGKKTAWEALDDCYAEVALSAPPIKLARASLKPEPGGKQRSLYAVDDIHTIVASYASVHMEKYMNCWGMRAKQTPADVAQWLVRSAHTKMPNVWVSLDYTDFNVEHELVALMQLDASLAGAWRNTGIAATPWKVAAAMWTSEAHANAWVARSGAEMYRTLGTLFSGDRNTARDNTQLHAVYSKILARATADHYDEEFELLETNYTGDDEDCLANDWIGAWWYMKTHELAGFVLKPQKQMVDTECHEFLQRNTAPDAVTVRPLFAALAQRASGNWYQDVYIWYDAVVQSVSANAWELHTRGMPIIYARRLAAVMLNAYMRVPDEKEKDGWLRLDWWPFRHGVAMQPIWYGLSGPVLLPPSIEGKVKPHELLPLRATDSWIEKRQENSGLRLNAERLDEYREYCAKQSYAKLYVRARADAHRDYALHKWPVRTATGTIPWREFGFPLPARIAIDDLWWLMAAHRAKRRPTTMDEVLSRLELDAKFVEVAGGLEKVLSTIKPHLLARFQMPIDPLPVPIAWMFYDAAVAAWLSTTPLARGMWTEDGKYRIVEQMVRFNVAERMHSLSDASKHEQHHASAVIHLIIAPNAAGKSTFVSKTRGAIDMDDMVGWTGMQALNARTIPYRKHLERYPLAQRVAETIKVIGATTITSQYAIADMLVPRNQRSYDVLITIIDPPAALLRERMLKRGWNNDKIDRRLERWQNIKQQYYNNKDILTESEKQALRSEESF